MTLPIEQLDMESCLASEKRCLESGGAEMKM